MARTIVIGDIHGAYRALKQVVERLRPQPDDCFIFLGDYVDGWSESMQVIDYLIAFSKDNTCLFIRGNHDVWCEDWLLDRGKNEVWQQQGGESTVRSYAFSSPPEREKHLDFFRRMKHFHIDAENNLFIHAGFSSVDGPEKEAAATHYTWDRTLWEMALTMNDRVQKDPRLYPKRLQLFREIFIGHTPTLIYKMDTPMKAVNVWNMDTGAGFYGKLSAMDIHTGEYWQSDPVRELYPREKGRNRT